MPKLMRKRVILAKIESSYGVDPTPTGADNAIQVRNLTINGLEATAVSRDLIRPYLGNSNQLIADKHSTVDFEVEIAGSGAAGTAPAYGPLLRACGYSQTITADTKTEYVPVSSSFESVTLYVNIDGILHKVTGARGTVDFEISAGAIPVMKFKFVGNYITPTDTAAASPTYTNFKNPLVSNNTNTTDFSFFSVTGLVLESLMISTGNTVDYRALIGDEYVQISDRKMTGDVSFELPTLATINTFSTAIAGTTGALSITQGTASGYKFKIDAPVVNLGNPTYADSKGIVMLKSPLLLLPNTGNDELKITVL